MHLRIAMISLLAVSALVGCGGSDKSETGIDNPVATAVAATLAAPTIAAQVEATVAAAQTARAPTHTASPTQSTRIPTAWLYRIDEGTLVHIEVSSAGLTASYNKNSGTGDWYIRENGTETPVMYERWGGYPLLLTGPRIAEVKQGIDPRSFGLDPPETRVKIADSEGKTTEFYLGQLTSDGINQYIRLVDSSEVFTVSKEWGEAVSNLAIDPPYAR